MNHHQPGQPADTDLLNTGWWITTITRTIRGGAAAAIGALGIGATDLASIPWNATIAAAGFGALTSLLAALAEAKTTDTLTNSMPRLLARNRPKRLRYPNGIPRTEELGPYPEEPGTHP